GRHGLRTGLLGVVLRRDADIGAGYVLNHVTDDALDLVRQRATIGVAQHHPARAGLVSGPGAGERVARILLVAVEEVLAVDQHFTTLRLRHRHAVADRGEIFLIGRLQRYLDLVFRRLRHK